MPKRKMTFDPELAAEAKSIVALAFRNGPIAEDHEEGGGHGLQVALAETEPSREVRDDACVREPTHAVLG
jgi:hypothetical protein